MHVHLFQILIFNFIIIIFFLNQKCIYKFHYYALHKDLTDIAESVSRFIDHDKKSHTPRSITPLVK
jgi:hypothetical protein